MITFTVNKPWLMLSLFSVALLLCLIKPNSALGLSGSEIILAMQGDTAAKPITATAKRVFLGMFLGTEYLSMVEKLPQAKFLI